MIAYRLATQADAPGVLSLLEEIMEHHAVAPPGRERLAPIVSRIIAAPDHCFLLADSYESGPAPEDRATAPGQAPSGAAPRIVGMCALVFSISTWSAASVCELQDVIVTEEHRRADLGRGLVAAAEEIARGRGCARLFLLAESWNFAAHAFYRSLGLQEKTCLYFERDLTAPAGG
jgi:GNAT superfamily N-acetyltransferase